ncbi:MAG: hypothetical protein HOW73_20390 [Polyangiaceae bacterium]|nr:hypothetical protein [Polyangiaceae bacterium]
MGDALILCTCDHSLDRHTDESTRPATVGACADCDCTSFARPVRVFVPPPKPKRPLMRREVEIEEVAGPVRLPPAGDAEPVGGWELGWWTR